MTGREKTLGSWSPTVSSLVRSLKQALDILSRFQHAAPGAEGRCAPICAFLLLKVKCTQLVKMKLTICLRIPNQRHQAFSAKGQTTST